MEITVTSHPGYDRTITIQPDGKFFFPSVGEVRAAGLTVPQLRERLLAGLEQQLNRPDLTISLREIRNLVNRVSVFGAVRNQNVFELKLKWRLTEALAAAGGPADNADLSRVTITRANRQPPEVITVDLSAVTKTGRAEENLELQAGDLIIVPQGVRPTVLLLGEVMRPSQYALEPGSKILDALSMAGGPKPEADLSAATIARLGVEGLTTVDLQSIIAQGDQSKNIELRGGDTIFIPAITKKVYVVGEVGKTGAVPLRGGERVMNALMAAGGPTKEADKPKAVLIRRGPDPTTPIVTKLDLDKLLTKGDITQNPALQNDDVLFVPSRKQKQTISGYVNLLYPLTWLQTLIQ
jgi:protein involved in polysaccharide export with SLBB domain